MIRDRLKELKAASRHNEHYDPVIVFLDDTAQDIREFLKEVEAVHDLLGIIGTNAREIKNLFRIILSMPGAQDSNSEVADRQKVICHTIRNVRSKLENLEISIKNNQSRSQVFRRIQIIQMHSLSELLVLHIEDYNNTLLGYRGRCAAIMKRQMEISNTGGELDELLDKESALFTDDIISESLEVQTELNIVRSRHEELKTIEKSLEEVRDLFVELAIHVQTQDEKINCIRYLVEKSGGLTETTVTKLDKAKRRAKRKRRRCRKIKFGLGVAATIFGFVVLCLLF